MSEFYSGAERVRSKSDIRVRISNRALVLLQQDITEHTVEGVENVEKLEPGEGAIIAVSHSTGYDVPFATDALGSKLDIVVADQSTHHQIGKEFSAYVWMLLNGKRNYLPVSYAWHEGQKRASRFNPEDAEPMIRVMNMGRSVMAAAHNPLAVDRDGNAVPPRPGYLAAYLGGSTNRPILPVGVSFHSAEREGKYTAAVKIGEPYVLDGTADTQSIRELSARRRRDELDDSENEVLVGHLKDLRADGKTVLDSIQLLQDLDEGYPVIDKAYTNQTE